MPITPSLLQRIGRTLAPAALASVALIALSSCNRGAGGGDQIGVALIVKTTTNPFFVSMQESAKDEAARNGVKLTLAAGKKDGDAATQIQAIEDAVSRGDKGILITPSDSSVNSAIARARQAGLYVIALDTPPNPADTVDITFATNNFEAGVAVGRWAAAQLEGKRAVIGLVDLFSNQVATVDYDRNQGFLVGVGIDPKDRTRKGDEAPSGRYTGGKGGAYVIAGAQASNGDTADGRTAMETLLSKNRDINVVYAINEPAAYGAYQALKAAGKDKDTLLVSIDGGCTGVDQVRAGVLGATAQQYPGKMAAMGVDAIVKLARAGTKPQVTPGLTFFDTGSQLVTEHPVPGLPSINAAQAAGLCWGRPVNGQG